MGVSVGPNLAAASNLTCCVDTGNAKSSKGQRSLINWNNWVAGSGGVSGYGQNGGTNENERVSATDPWGNTRLVWESRPSGNGDADGGWNTDWFNIDNTKLYRYSVWVRRTSSTSGGTFYLGLYANGDGSRRMDNNTVEGNAYWECTGTGNLTQNQWYLWVGHVYPANTSETGRHPNTGYYTTTSGRVAGIGGCNIGSGDVKWSLNSTQGIHRTYHYYCGDSTTRLQWYQPRVDLVDGTEPSIQDLLNNAGNTLYDLSTTKLNFTASTPTYVSTTSLNSGASGGWTTATTSILNNDVHTVLFWWKLNTTAAYGANGYSGSWDQIFRSANGGSDRSPGVWRYPSERKLHWRYDPGNSDADFSTDTTGTYAVGGTPFAIDTWYYVGVSKNGATATVYVNGVKLGTRSVSNPKTSGNAAILLLPDNAGIHPVNLSSMGPVQIYDKVLTDAEVAQNWLANKSRFGY
jgi:hypothetical protein